MQRLMNVAGLTEQAQGFMPLLADGHRLRDRVRGTRELEASGCDVGDGDGFPGPAAGAPVRVECLGEQFDRLRRLPQVPVGAGPVVQRHRLARDPACAPGLAVALNNRASAYWHL